MQRRYSAGELRVRLVCSHVYLCMCSGARDPAGIGWFLVSGGLLGGCGALKAVAVLVSAARF